MLLSVLVLYFFFERISCYTHASVRRRSTSLCVLFQQRPPLLQALFTAAEWAGRAVRTPLEGSNNKALYLPSTYPRSVASVAEDIRNEYVNIFWATGNMDLSLWKDNCTFADPFSSFGGPGSSARFKRNADNLARFVDEATIKITSFEVEGYVVKVGWVFKGYLKLPWRPILAAAGVTLHILDESSLLICDYREIWKSDPFEVVRRLFVPSQRR